MGKAIGIVIHHSSSAPYQVGDPRALSSALNTLKNEGKGYNYYVAGNPDGSVSIYNPVPESQYTNHMRGTGSEYRTDAGQPSAVLNSQNTISAAFVSPNDASVTPAMREGMRNLVSDIGVRNGIPSTMVFGHGDLQGGKSPLTGNNGNRERTEGAQDSKYIRDNGYTPGSSPGSTQGMDDPSTPNAPDDPSGNPDPNGTPTDQEMNNQLGSEGQLPADETGAPRGDYFIDENGILNVNIDNPNNPENPEQGQQQPQQPAAGEADKWFQDEHSTHPLARDEEFNTSKQQEIDGQAEQTEPDKAVPVAGSEQPWDEPPSTDNGGPGYPQKDVEGYESGIVKEVDNRPGSERIREGHPSGAYRETDPAGNVTERAQGDSTSVTKGNTREDSQGEASSTSNGSQRSLSKAGDQQIQAKGAANVQSGTDTAQVSKGDKIMIVKGTLVIQATAIKLVSTGGGVDINSSAECNIQAKSELNLSAGSTMAIEAKGAMHIKTAGLLAMMAAADAKIQAGGAMHLKAGGNIKVQGAEWHDASGKTIITNLWTNVPIHTPSVEAGSATAQSPDQAKADHQKRASENEGRERADAPGGKVAADSEAKNVGDPGQRNQVQPPAESTRRPAPRPMNSDRPGMDNPRGMGVRSDPTGGGGLFNPRSMGGLQGAIGQLQSMMGGLQGALGQALSLPQSIMSQISRALHVADAGGGAAAVLGVLGAMTSQGSTWGMGGIVPSSSIAGLTSSIPGQITNLMAQQGGAFAQTLTALAHIDQGMRAMASAGYSPSVVDGIIAGLGGSAAQAWGQAMAGGMGGQSLSSLLRSGFGGGGIQSILGSFGDKRKWSMAEIKAHLLLKHFAKDVGIGNSTWAPLDNLGQGR